MRHADASADVRVRSHNANALKPRSSNERWTVNGQRPTGSRDRSVFYEMKRLHSCKVTDNQIYVEGLEKCKQLAQQSGTNSKMSFVYAKAINSIKSCEVPIRTRADAKALPFIGNFVIAEMENIKPFEDGEASLPSAPPPPPTAAGTSGPPQLEDGVLSFSVPNWLKSLGYDMYIQSFMEQGFDNLLAVQALDESDLAAVGVKLPGHRKTLIVASERLRAATLPPAVATSAPAPAAILPVGPLSTPAAPSRRPAPLSPPTAQAAQPSTSQYPSATADAPPTPAVRRPAMVPSIITVEKGEIPIVTHSFIDMNTSSEVVIQKGIWRYLEGKLRSVVLKGAEIAAEIRSKRPDAPHKVVLTTKINEPQKKCSVAKAMCTCVTKPDTGFCKHIVCVLVYLNQQHPALKDSPMRIDMQPFEQQLVKPGNGGGIPQGSSLSAQPSATPITLPSANKKKMKSLSSESTPGTEPPAKKPRPYIPKHRSCAWALLIALHQSQFSMSSQGLLKEELIVAARPHSDTPFLPVANSQDSYTGWSAMTTLQDKGLVLRGGRPHRFKLSSSGLDLAERLVATLSASAPPQLPQKPPETDSDATILDPQLSSKLTQIPSLSSSRAKPSAAKPVGRVLRDDSDDGTDVDTQPVQQSQAPSDDRPLSHFDCDVVLLVDNREVKNNRGLKKKLADKGVVTESRTLDLGDVVWIARGRGASGDQEYMLDCVIERKRVSDLEMSLEDQRFVEQKFRLQKCGLKVLYLVEGKLERTHPNFEILENAMIQTLVQSGFTVYRTQSEEETLALLATITSSFIRTLRGDDVEQCRSVMKKVTYAEFNSAGSKSKNLTVRDLWSMQLLQIRGCTIEKAKLIVERYPTPRHLLQAYARLRSDIAREEMLKDLSLDSTGLRKIGKPLSRDVYLLYQADAYPEPEK